MNVLKVSRKIVAVHTKRSLAVPAGSYLPADDVTNRVLNVVKSIKSTPRTISVESHFTVDLGFDSLLRKDVLSKLEEEFCVPVPAPTADSILSVHSAVKYFSSHPKAR